MFFPVFSPSLQVCLLTYSTLLFFTIPSFVTILTWQLTFSYLYYSLNLFFGFRLCINLSFPNPFFHFFFLHNFIYFILCLLVCFFNLFLFSFSPLLMILPSFTSCFLFLLRYFTHSFLFVYSRFNGFIHPSYPSYSSRFFLILLVSFFQSILLSSFPLLILSTLFIPFFNLFFFLPILLYVCIYFLPIFLICFFIFSHLTSFP